jgi:hypothetical protein
MKNDHNNIKSFIDKLKKYNIPKPVVNENIVKILSMRDMLKITRSLNEGFKVLPIDQKTHEEGIKRALLNLKAIPKFNNIEIIDNSIFWSGVINDMITFVYKISEDGSKDGAEFKTNDKLNVGTPETSEIMKKLENYYDIFFDYYQNNR